VRQTTAAYVGVKIRTVRETLAHVTDQIASVNKRLAVATKAEAASKNLDPLQQLVVVGQEDNAETRLGNLIAQQNTLQQQLAFAQEVESAKIVEPAAPLRRLRTHATAPAGADRVHPRDAATPVTAASAG
jgi:hypothetical protein